MHFHPKHLHTHGTMSVRIRSDPKQGSKSKSKASPVAEFLYKLE